MDYSRCISNPINAINQQVLLKIIILLMKVLFYVDYLCKNISRKCYKKVLPAFLSLKSSAGCEEVFFEDCRKLGFTTTSFPNSFQDQSQKEAIVRFSFYQKYFERKCYRHSLLYVCASLFPRCGPGGRRLTPCRPLCEGAYIVIDSENWVSLSIQPLLLLFRIWNYHFLSLFLPYYG